MQIAGRPIRASWSMVVVYLTALGIALEPGGVLTAWIKENYPAYVKWFELLRITLGILVASGARSYLGRKAWDDPGERYEKTREKLEATPPTK